MTTEPGDDVGRELLALLPVFDNDRDRDAFFAQMVADRRLVIRVEVGRVYGTSINIGA